MIDGTKSQCPRCGLKAAWPPGILCPARGCSGELEVVRFGWLSKLRRGRWVLPWAVLLAWGAALLLSTLTRP